MKRKKVFSAIFGVMMILAIGGCSNGKNSNNLKTPYTICKDNIYISYYDSVDDAQENQIEGVDIICNENYIRSIYITTPEVTTYPNICVGDNVSKITDVFQYELQSVNTYMVLFNGNVETEPDTEGREDGWIWITYNTEDDIITKISIYDVKYGREMR